MIYEESTQGILIRVRPQFSLADSSLDEGRFVFTYHVEMENQGEEEAQLLFHAGHELTRRRLRNAVRSPCAREASLPNYFTEDIERV